MDLSMLGKLSGQTNSGDQRSQDLLAQINDLLQQYLALGGDTPVAAQAQQLSAAIDATMGGTAEPPEMGGGQGAPVEGSPAEEQLEPPAEEQQEPPDEGDQGYTGGGMAEAHKGAEAFLRKANKKGSKAKAA